MSPRREDVGSSVSLTRVPCEPPRPGAALPPVQPPREREIPGYNAGEMSESRGGAARGGRRDE